MLPVVWRKSARAGLLEIIRYIANEDPQAARQLKERLESAVLPLSEHPICIALAEFPARGTSSSTPTTW